MAALTQMAANALQDQLVASPEKPAVEILSFKIVSDYYPILDRKSPIPTADSSDFPLVKCERVSRRSSGMGESGKLRSELRVISTAQWQGP